MRKQKAEESVNTEWVERIAVNRLENALLSTGLVVPTIPTGDKAPSWDGEISLYPSQISFPKSELVGRIPVQVKGTYVKEFQKKAVYQVDVADLRNFFRDGGAIFFVVQIKTDEQYRIFYTPLLRFQLRRLLEQAGNQKRNKSLLKCSQSKIKAGWCASYLISWLIVKSRGHCCQMLKASMIWQQAEW